ncbi:venom serine carboxypeptidase [Thrips palmi]|uniref:Carboxypeptidase n=1 Tax=Thrips palmi TaxID=161013 RepID=A0A6P8YKG9_THRPL|nr:venom serine carboxypeptidase [Thrips palmi]
MSPLLLILVALAGRCHGSWYTRATAAPPSLVQEVPDTLNADGDIDPGAPLFLTPLIESGNVTGAQRAAQVKPFAGNVQSYAGFLTVNKALDSNMFFWYFPAENQAPDAPVVLWLQGGPGASSLYGLFSENGPYESQNGKVTLRKYSWSKQYNLLYIDNPVGSGYSFTGSDEGYTRNQTQVGRDLYSAVVQFYRMFPKLQGRAFFITGESYAGKYVPALGYAIHTNNPKAAASDRINLQGLFIGNGFTDPENMMKYSDLTFQLGLVDAAGSAALKASEDRIVALIQQRRWLDAFMENDRMMGGDLISYPTLFKNLTGFDFYFNFLYTKDPDRSDGTQLVQSAWARRALHVGNSTWDHSEVVEGHLREDMLQSVAPWLAELLEHYRVMVYNGQLDIIVAYALTDNYLSKLKWSGAEEFRRAPRKKWVSKGELAGYVKQAGKLSQVLVRDAGHMVPADQPRWAMDLLNRFIANKPF